MKSIRSVLLSLLLMPYAVASDWDETSTVLQASWLVAHSLDWISTRDIAKNCNQRPVYEQNPVLGPCPSGEQVDSYFLMWVIIHTGLSYYMPKNHRLLFQYVTLGVSSMAALNNYSLGLGLQIDF